MSSYQNTDLTPIATHWRNWRALDFMSLWLVIASSLPSYMLASSLMLDGFTWWQALLIIFLANLLLLIPLLLNSDAGFRYGLTFPLYVRVSFGLSGAKLPSFCRGLVAAIWFGLQVWLGGYALWQLCQTWVPSYFSAHRDLVFAIVIFWLINISLLMISMETLRKIFTKIALLLVLICLPLLWWLIVEKNCLTFLIAHFQFYQSPHTFRWLFLASISTVMGYYTPLCLNIADFSRFASSSNSYKIGQAIGLPCAITLIAFLGLLCFALFTQVLQQSIWNPIIIHYHTQDKLFISVIMLLIMFATTFSNITINGIAAGYSFANISPKHLSFRRGVIVAALLAMILLPWKLIGNPQYFLFSWLNISSAILTPILGIMLFDYLIFRQRKLFLSALFDPAGCYGYHKGINWCAIIAFSLGVLINLPGFLIDLSYFTHVRLSMGYLFAFSWPISLLASGVFYYLLMKFFDPYFGGFNQDIS